MNYYLQKSLESVTVTYTEITHTGDNFTEITTQTQATLGQIEYKLGVIDGEFVYSK